MFEEIRKRANKIVTMIDQGRCWITPISRTDVDILLQFRDEATKLLNEVNSIDPQDFDIMADKLYEVQDFLKRWEEK
jgi:hypothetical protein